MRQLIAGNWKMNTTVKEAMILARELKEALSKVRGKDLLVCPPFVALAELRTIFHKTNIKLGAQNMHFEEKGAFTAEISPLMLKELCEYVILGHSERRHIFDEDDHMINKKVLAALKQGLRPILCVGEKEDEREEGKEQEVVKNQLLEGLREVTNNEIMDITIAYEPVWAIGTGKTATPEQAEEMHSFIRSVLREEYGDEAKEIRILYGGSVKPDNASELLKKDNIDGALVGGASLNAKDFAGIATSD